MNGTPNKESLILVFCKRPVPGAVKTRLAQAIGPERAAYLYARWIGEVLEILQPLRRETPIIGYFTGGNRADFARWNAKVDEWWPQPSGNLGERLAHGFAEGHKHAEKVLAIGTDCLELSRGVVGDALCELEKNDVVIGPASDGGYYLVGTARHLPGLFASVRWSSEYTLSDQLNTCRTNGWVTAMLPLRSDIDTWDDWRRYCQRLGSDPHESSAD